jgi:hypothetical protein
MPVMARLQLKKAVNIAITNGKVTTKKGTNDRGMNSMHLRCLSIESKASGTHV